MTTELKIFQKGFNYSQDGPGNRLVYHLQGCNMRCPWCANPESLFPGGTLMVTPELLLESVCPRGAIHGSSLNRTLCEDCRERECVTRHRNKGITLSCASYSIEQLVTEALEAAPLFIDGGGVTFTGGEPTCQMQPLEMLMQNLKQVGINTAIETNATHPHLETLIPLIDHFIVDIKHTDDAIHRHVTGVSNAMIKKNIGKLLSAGKALALRIPLIQGFNTSEETQAGFLDYFETLDTSLVTIELLPYHEYGKSKYAQCGMEYTVHDGSVPRLLLERFGAALQQRGLRLIRS